MNKITKIALTLIFGLLVAGSVRAATLYDRYVELTGVFPTRQERAEKAFECGVVFKASEYKGTYSQNIGLLKCLPKPGMLGANPVTGFKKTLSSSMTSTQTTVPLSSITTTDGTTLTMAILGGEVFLSIEPGSSKEEIIRCTAISSTTFTSCTRGLAFSGTSVAQVDANRYAHNAGSTVIMSNVHYVYNTTTKANTWLDTQTFASSTSQTIQRIYLGTSTPAYLENNAGVLYYCNNSASCAAIGAGANTYSFQAPFWIDGSRIGLASSTGDFLYRDGTDLAIRVQPTGGVATSTTGLIVDTSDNFAFTGTLSAATTTLSSTGTNPVLSINQGGAGLGVRVNTGGLTVLSGETTLASNALTIGATSTDALINGGETTLHSHAYDLFAGITSDTAKTYRNYQIPFSTNAYTSGNGTATLYNTGNSLGWAASSDAGNEYIITERVYRDKNAFTFGLKNLITEFELSVDATTDEQAGWGFTEGTAPFSDYDDASDDAACFTVGADGKLYAHTSTGAGGAAHTETEITGITLTNPNTYRIEFIKATSAKFYVNGVLKATHTTNLPNGNNVKWGFGSGGNGINIDSAIAPWFAIEK